MSSIDLEMEDLRDASEIVYSSLYAIFPYSKAPLDYMKAQSDLNSLLLSEGKQLVKECDDYQLKALKTFISHMELAKISSGMDLDTLRDILNEMSSSQNKDKNNQLRMEAAKRIFNTLLNRAQDIDIQSFRNDLINEINKLKVSLERKNSEEGYVDPQIKDDIEDLEYQDFLLKEIQTTLSNPSDPNANATLKMIIESTKNTIINRISALNCVCIPNSPEFYQLLKEALLKMFKTKEWLFSSPTFKENLINYLEAELVNQPEILQMLNRVQANINTIVANHIKNNVNSTIPLVDDEDAHLYSEDYIRYNHPNDYVPKEETTAAPKF